MSDRKKIDLALVDLDWCITVDPMRRILRNATIGIEKGRIVFIGSTAEFNSRFDASSIYDGRGKLASPGFVDCHIHTSFQMARGMACNVGVQQFLFERMYPYEASLDASDIYLSAKLSLSQLARSGVTTFIDAGNYSPMETVKAAELIGLRGVVARSFFDIFESKFGAVPAQFIESPEVAIWHAVDLVEMLPKSDSRRIHACFQFRGLNNVSDQSIRRLHELAQNYSVGLQTHACFARSTRDASIKQYGVSEIQRLMNLGVLDKTLLLVHAGWIDENDLALLIQHKPKIVTAPSSSCHNAYGNLIQGKTPELFAAKMAVGIGSDHASSGTTDMLQEMRIYNLVQKEVRMDPLNVFPEDAIEMATIGGARCAGLEADIGSIELGKRADIVIFDTHSADWQPIYNPVYNLVCSAFSESIAAVIVDGQFVIENKEFSNFDEAELLLEVQARAPGILKRSGLERFISSKWPIHYSDSEPT